MKTKVKGRYNGRVVVLDEPAPVDREVKVTVEFPEEPLSSEGSDKPLQWYWEESRRILAGIEGSVSEELWRQRDLE